MKKTFYIALVMAMSFTLAMPAYAVDEVNLDSNAQIYIPTPAITLTVGDSTVIDSIVIYPTYFTVDISANSVVTFRSADKYTLTADEGFVFSCWTDNSTLTLTTTVSKTVTVTPTTTVCQSGGGGGGGGGTTPPPVVEPVDDEVVDEVVDEPADEVVDETAGLLVNAEDVVSLTPAEPAVNELGQVTLGQMTDDASTVASGDVTQVIAKMGMVRDVALEATYSEGIVADVTSGVAGVTAEVRNVVNNFVTYGTKSTNILGAGERAGVVNSYKEAFGKLPTTTEEWNDVVKIANGRWPNERSQAKEDRAALSFETIYLRTADMDNPNDNAAVTVMAYGLRPANRNLDSEKVAITTFRYVFGYSPKTASAWDAVRAIAYSGSTR